MKQVLYMTHLMNYTNTVLRCSCCKIHRYVAAPLFMCSMCNAGQGKGMGGCTVFVCVCFAQGGFIHGFAPQEPANINSPCYPFSFNLGGGGVGGAKRGREWGMCSLRKQGRLLSVKKRERVSKKRVHLTLS